MDGTPERYEKNGASGTVVMVSSLDFPERLPGLESPTREWTYSNLPEDGAWKRLASVAVDVFATARDFARFGDR